MEPEANYLDLLSELANGFASTIKQDAPTRVGDSFFTTGQVSGVITSMLKQLQEEPMMARVLAQALKIVFNDSDNNEKQNIAANLAPFLRLLESDFGKFSRHLADNSAEERAKKAELLDLASNYVSVTKLTTEETHTRLLVPDKTSPERGYYQITDSADAVRIKIAHAIKRCGIIT
jgi:hypothetical protein